MKRRSKERMEAQKKKHDAFQALWANRTSEVVAVCGVCSNGFGALKANENDIRHCPFCGVQFAKDNTFRYGELAPVKNRKGKP